MVGAVQKQAIIFGNENAKYHPLLPMAARMREVLGSAWALETVDDSGDDIQAMIGCCDLCIAYCEFGDQMRPESLDAITKYCERGGTLLVLHNGISMEEAFRHSLNKSMLGASFTGHPPYEQLPALSFYLKALPDITKADFILHDEAYRFRFEQPEVINEFLWYSDADGIVRPAGWERSVGKGKYVYLMPGHGEAAYRQPQLVTLLHEIIITKDFVISS